MLLLSVLPSSTICVIFSLIKSSVVGYASNLATTVPSGLLIRSCGPNFAKIRAADPSFNYLKARVNAQDFRRISETTVQRSDLWLINE